jgi:hypothetical protein
VTTFIKKEMKKTYQPITVCVDNENFISIHLPGIEQRGIRISGIQAGKVEIVNDKEVKGIQFDK